MSSTWGAGEKDAFESKILTEWQTFLQGLATKVERSPDFLDREMNAYRAMQKYKSKTADSSGMLINPGADERRRTSRRRQR